MLKLRLHVISVVFFTLISITPQKYKMLGFDKFLYRFKHPRFFIRIYFKSYFRQYRVYSEVPVINHSFSGFRTNVTSKAMDSILFIADNVYLLACLLFSRTHDTEGRIEISFKRMDILP